MFPDDPTIRPDERRPAWTAFALLILLMTGHALLETARDALFLQSIDASRLPWVYLLVAGTSVVVLEIQRRWHRRSRGSLGATLVAAAALTALTWAALPSLGDPGLYALYVLSSVAITLVLVQFWLAMGRTFDSRQAKRLYAFIGTGSVLGAIVGFGVAGALVQVVSARHLVLAAAVALLGAAGLTLVVREGTGPVERVGVGVASLSEAMSRPYVRLLATALVVSTLALTVGDFLFKAAVVDAVASEDLASTFAMLYLLLNILSLGVQVLLVNRVIRGLGAVEALLVLPAFLMLGAVGLAAGLGAGAAIALKGADSGLRHSLHRTVVELLYVPMPERIRVRVKGLMDVLAQRGGQAIASVLILAALAAGATTEVLAGILVLLLVAWLGVGLRLRRPYVDVFRQTLDDVLVKTNLEFPDLDLASLEAVISALNSPNDKRVLAALSVLEREKRLGLVPVMLLYHPSDEVVVKVLDLFAIGRRDHFIPVAERIQGQATPAVHAAVVRATMALNPDPDALRKLTESFCRATRTTATVYLLSMGELDSNQAKATLDDLLDHENGSTAALAIVSAARWTATPTVERYVMEFLEHPELEIRRRAIDSIAQMKGEPLLGPLISSLTDRQVRHLARQALLAYGQVGLDALAHALRASETKEALRWELPRAVAEFGGASALTILEQTLAHSGGMVQYRAIRALERLVDEAVDSLRVDARILEDASMATLGIAYRLMAQRLHLQQGVVEATDTAAHRYLIRLLRDKEKNAIERVIRLVGLGVPDEDFASIVRGLSSGTSAVRSSSLELLELFTPPLFRTQLLGLVDGGDDARRLRSAGKLASAVSGSYAQVLAGLVDSRSESLRTLAITQVGDIGLAELGPKLASMPIEPSTMLGDVLTRVLEQLARSPRPQEA